MSRWTVDVGLDKNRWSPSPLPGQVVLVTTVDEEGVPNVATKSWVSMAAFGPPPVVMFACNLEHQTARNIEATGEFAINIPGVDLAEKCWKIGSNREGRFSGLSVKEASVIRAPLVADCRAFFECKLDGMRQWGSEAGIFGYIVAASIDGGTLVGEEPVRYDAVAPFFFLERGWMAPLGRAMKVDEASSKARQIYTILAVRDLARSVEFYSDVFGWPKRVETPVYVELVQPDGRCLGLYQRDGYARNTEVMPVNLSEGEVSGTEIYLHCDQLGAVAARLRAAGARQLSAMASREWGDKAAYYADLDGNVIVIAEPLSMCAV